MKIANLKPLNMHGMAHIVAPLMVMLMMAVAGTFFVVASHANPSSTPNGHIKINAYATPINVCRFNPKNSTWPCAPLSDKSTNVSIYGYKSGAICTASLKAIEVHQPHAYIGNDRLFFCTPGKYRVSLVPGVRIDYVKNGKTIRNSIKIYQDVIVTSNHTTVANLGTTN